MNKTKIRCLSLALAIVGVMVIGSGVALGQTGLALSTTCVPGVPIAQGDAYTCNFIVTNASITPFTIQVLTVAGIDILPGGCISTSTMTPTTTLAAAGDVGDACTGFIASGNAPFTCSATGENLMVGPVVVSGVDAGNNGASQTTSNGPFVQGIDCNDQDACTIDSCIPTSDPSPVEGCVHVPDPACEDIDGRMTGGGSVFAGMNRVTHGFELHCNRFDLPNNLEVNWGRGNRFHLEELLTATCTEDPAIDQTPPGHSPFDTFIGTGIGRCNGESGALIEFTFVDGGEPGFKHDTASIEITNCPAGVGDLLVSGPLKKGNHQAHRNTPQ